jgi:hypothetical protein
LSREWEEKIKQHNSGWFLKKKIWLRNIWRGEKRKLVFSLFEDEKTVGEEGAQDENNVTVG